MKRHVNRRNFLKTTCAVASGIGLAGLGGARLLAAETAPSAAGAEKLGWQLAMQAWSYHFSTMFETIDQTASLGLRYLEGIPRQNIGGDLATTQFGPGMPQNARTAVKKKLADAGVKLVNFGVYKIPKGQDRETFDFAKEMGIETLVSEPEEDTVEQLDKLCQEYGINLAIHNHPKPSHYWNPDTVLKVCKGRSKRIGACADTGHWTRSGLNALEGIKKLDGRIISFHFKDLNKASSSKALDVPWGTGICKAKAMLAEIHRQGFKGVFSIEYEHDFGKVNDQLAGCIAFFNKTAAELAG
jgi:sugar phosphate isomerase/epimerase